MTRTIVALITGVLLGAFLTKVSSGNKSSESSIQNPASLALEQAESVLNADLGDLDPRYVQMFDALAAIVDQEVAERRRLEERLDQLSAQLKGEPQTVTQSAARQDRRNRNSINLQRSLVSRMVDAGLSEQEAQEIKTRLDSISMAELEL